MGAPRDDDFAAPHDQPKVLELLEHSLSNRLLWDDRLLRVPNHQCAVHLQNTKRQGNRDSSEY